MALLSLPTYLLELNFGVIRGLGAPHFTIAGAAGASVIIENINMMDRVTTMLATEIIEKKNNNLS